MNVTAALAALSEAAKSPATVSSTELRLIVDEMCRGAPSLTANRSLWHSYIRGCCRRGEWRHALRVATENMRAWGLAPDAVTVGIVMTDGLVVRDPAAATSKRTDVVVLQRCVSDVALRLAAQFAGDRAIATNERVVACVELAGRVARADLEGDPVSGKVRILLTR